MIVYLGVLSWVFFYYFFGVLLWDPSPGRYIWLGDHDYILYLFAVLAGLGDAAYNCLPAILMGILFKDETAPAFANLKVRVCILFWHSPLSTAVAIARLCVYLLGRSQVDICAPCLRCGIVCHFELPLGSSSGVHSPVGCKKVLISGFTRCPMRAAPFRWSQRGKTSVRGQFHVGPKVPCPNLPTN